MKKLVPFLTVCTAAAAAAACSPVADDIDSQIAESLAEPILIGNTGDPELEGHTPQGFAGSGVGLFAGDNLNAGFPDGEGVQLFVAFPLPDGIAPPKSATVTSDHMMVRGDPFASLGSLRAEPVRFDRFGPEVFSIPTVGSSEPCVPSVGPADGDTATGAIACDVTAAAIDAVSEGADHLQLRIRFDVAGDGDGQQDLALFFLSDSNTNEPGIFSLTLSRG